MFGKSQTRNGGTQSRRTRTRKLRPSEVTMLLPSCPGKRPLSRRLTVIISGNANRLECLQYREDQLG